MTKCCLVSNVCSRGKWIVVSLLRLSDSRCELLWGKPIGRGEKRDVLYQLPSFENVLELNMDFGE